MRQSDAARSALTRVGAGVQEQPAAATVHGIRLTIGATQAELADLCGVHETTISRWERGQGQPDGATLMLLQYMVAAAGGPDAIREHLAAASSDNFTRGRQLIGHMAWLQVSADGRGRLRRRDLVAVADAADTPLVGGLHQSAVDAADAATARATRSRRRGAAGRQRSHRLALSR